MLHLCVLSGGCQANNPGILVLLCQQTCSFPESLHLKEPLGGDYLKKTHKSASDYHQIGPNGFCKPWKINSSLFSTPSQNAMPLLSCCPCRISSAVVLLGHILGFAWGTLETMVNLQETSHICPIFSWLVDFAIDRQRIRILKYLTKIDPI